MIQNTNGMTRFGAKSAKLGQKTAPNDKSKETPKDDPKDKKSEDPKDKKSDDSAITEDELKQTVTTAVQEAVKAALPEHLKGLVTTDKLSEIIGAELAKQKGDSKSINADQIKSAATEAAKTFMDGFRRENKFEQSKSDSARPGGEIEMPYSWSKGNLPPHAKQLLNLCMKRDINHGIPEADVQKAEAKGKALLDRMQAKGLMGKALTSTGAGTGDEFVPTDLSSELQRRFYLSSDLVAILALTEVDMPSQPYEYPLSTTRPTFLLNTTENTATTASDPGTSKITLDAKKIMAQVNASYEVDEDSIIPVLPWIQEQLGLAAAEKFESMLINGDTTATHMDSDIHAITNAGEKAFKGFRKLALAVGALSKDLSTGGITDANLRSMKKAMGKYGVNPMDLILVCGVAGQSDLEGMTEVSTVDKFGQSATILTGKLPKWRNIPIVTSAACRETLNASGVYDGSTVTKGSILLVNRRAFMLGRRRAFTVEVDKDITTQTHKLVASLRRAFTPMETPSATIQTVCVGYNYTA